MDEDLKQYFGKKGVDTVTGLGGVITACAYFQYNAPQLSLQHVDADGNLKTTWLERDRIQVQ